MSTSNSGETKQFQQQPERSGHAQASDHGHTGEGAASALARLLSDGEKQRREAAASDELPGGGHP